MVDLGTALNIALVAGDAFPEAIIHGDADLIPVENPTWVAELLATVREVARSVGMEI